MKAPKITEPAAGHGLIEACYIGGPGSPYYKPFMQCLCGWATVNGGPRTWEEAGAEFDEHLVSTDPVLDGSPNLGTEIRVEPIAKRRKARRLRG